MAKKNFFSSSSNPFMKESAYQDSSREVLDADMTQAHVISEKMTVSGAVNKSFILFGLMMITTFLAYANPHPVLMWGGAIGGLVVVLIAAFKRHLSPTLAPIYALLEGLFVGGITAIYGGAFGGASFFRRSRSPLLCFS